MGAGPDVCGKWLDARRVQPESQTIGQRFQEALTVAWVQGYISGMNDQANLSLPAYETVKAVIDSECRADPTKPFFMIVRDIYAKTARRR